jgi:hypothetical protein
MKLSEMIRELTATLAERGDLEIFMSSDEEGNVLSPYSDGSVEYYVSENDMTPRLGVFLWPGWAESEISCIAEEDLDEYLEEGDQD